MRSARYSQRVGRQTPLPPCAIEKPGHCRIDVGGPVRATAAAGTWSRLFQMRAWQVLQTVSSTTPPLCGWVSQRLLRVNIRKRVTLIPARASETVSPPRSAPLAGPVLRGICTDGIHDAALLALVLVLPVPGQALRRRMVRTAARVALFVLRHASRGAASERLPATPCVVVANHSSYLDASRCMPPATCISFVIKREVSRATGEPAVAQNRRALRGSRWPEKCPRHTQVFRKAAAGVRWPSFPKVVRARAGITRFRSGAVVGRRTQDCGDAHSHSRHSRRIARRTLLPIQHESR